MLLHEDHDDDDESCGEDHENSRGDTKRGEPGRDEPGGSTAGCSDEQRQALHHPFMPHQHAQSYGIPVNIASG